MKQKCEMYKVVYKLELTCRWCWSRNWREPTKKKLWNENKSKELSHHCWVGISLLNMREEDMLKGESFELSILYILVKEETAEIVYRFTFSSFLHLICRT